jgi:CDP-paratose synthetase
MDKIIKTILLTGATGYLGSRLLEKLLQQNYTVIIVKRKTSSFEKIKELANIKFYNNSEADIKQLFEENNIDLILHLATLYGRKGETLMEIKNANLDFPLLLLNYALENDVKYFINTGTSLPFLTNQYALFKNQFAECLQFFNNKITSINILLEHFYGPGDDSSKFITAMIHKMKENVKEIQLTAGIQIRDFIYTEDVLNAYLTMIDSLNKFKGYNVVPLGSGETCTIREIVELIKLYSKSDSELQFGAIPMRDTELMKSDADISILKELGWKPKYSLKQGLELTVDSVKI